MRALACLAVGPGFKPHQNLVTFPAVKGTWVPDLRKVLMVTNLVELAILLQINHGLRMITFGWFPYEMNILWDLTLPLCIKLRPYRKHLARFWSNKIEDDLHYLNGDDSMNDKLLHIKCALHFMFIIAFKHK